MWSPVRKSLVRHRGSLRRARALPVSLRWRFSNSIPRRRRLLFDGHNLVFIVTSEESDRYARDVMSREPEMLDWLGTFAPDEVLIDIGANIGTVALPAGVNNSVIAVEPYWTNFYILQRNIRESGLQRNVTAICVAIGTRTVMTTLNVTSRHEAGSNNAIGAPVEGLVSKAHSEILPALPSRESTRRVRIVRDHQHTMAFSLDDFISHALARQPWHLKLDVDGQEAEILLASTKVLVARNLRSLMVRLDVKSPLYASVLSHLQSSGLVLRNSFLQSIRSGNHLFVR